MKPRLFTILSVLSGVLFAIAAVLWVRGFWISDTFIVGWERMGPEGATGRLIYLCSDCNQFALMYRWQHDSLSAEELAKWQKQPPSVIQFDHWTNPTLSFSLWSAGRGDLPWERAGFDYLTSDNLVPRPGLFDRSLAVPFWFVMVAFGALPAFRTATLWRAKRHRPGYCVTCGYDLRASRDRCPECGTAIPVQSPSEPPSAE